MLYAIPYSRLVTTLTTSPLHTFIDDFDHSVSSLGWWTDAVLVIATAPAPDWTALTAHWRVYLNGPASQAHNMPEDFIARHMQGNTVWAGALDPTEFIDASLFGNAWSRVRLDKNLLVAHVQRQPENRVAVGYQCAADQQTLDDGDSPELSARLDNMNWVLQQVQTLIPGDMRLP